MAKAWTRPEVEATVASYFEMLELELRGEPYNKTAYRNRLLPLLNGRSGSAVERKHQNISAVLIDTEDFPYVDGYKPLRNIQGLLREVVSDRLQRSPSLRAVATAVASAPSELPTVDDIISILQARPDARVRQVRESQPQAPRRVLSREAANVELGRAGELLTIRFEQARLSLAGADHLAGQIEHVSEQRGDAEGYDVLSFEETGRERLIEVKTTAFGKGTPFFVSPNQVRVSESTREQYHVYRLFRFRRDPGLFVLPGAIRDTCSLEASEYRAQVV